MLLFAEKSLIDDKAIIDYEATKTMKEIAYGYGLEFEEHRVATKDGYIIKM